MPSASAVEDHTDKSVIIDDTGDLAGLLTNVAGNSHVSGNVLLDPTEEAGISSANDAPGSVDTAGNDGAGTPEIIDLVVDGVHYTESSGKGGDVLDNDGAGIRSIGKINFNAFTTRLGANVVINYVRDEEAAAETVAEAVASSSA